MDSGRSGIGEAPINQSMLEHADREVRMVLANAARGDPEAQQALIRYAAAARLERGLLELAAAADRCAPTMEQIKISKCYGADVVALRRALLPIEDTLSAAAGRAVVIDLLHAKLAPVIADAPAPSAA